MPVSPDVDVCVLSNTGDPIVTAAGVPLSQVYLVFKLVNFKTRKAISVMDVITGELVCMEPVEVLLTTAGEFTTTLWPNSRGDIQTMYQVSASDKSITPFFILIPDAATCTLMAAKSAYGVGSGSWIDSAASPSVIAAAAAASAQASAELALSAALGPLVIVDAVDAPITVTLPTINTAVRYYRADATANTITIEPDLITNTVMLAASITGPTVQGETMMLAKIGTDWRIIV
ncbi:MAG: hypothetical protein ACOYL3_06985 [Desulfuromonadaceae bacterium]